MENSGDSVLKLQDTDLYEFQAWDKFFRRIRGRIEAGSKSTAKATVKSRGYYLPIVWLHGKEPLRVLGIHDHGEHIEQHSPELKLKREDGNSLIYATRNLPRYMISLMILFIGIGLIVYCNTQNVGSWKTSFICGIGILLVVVGTLIMCHYLELRVDKQARQIVIRMRVIPGKWVEQQINTGVADQVILHQETIYTSERATVYVVSLVTSGEQIWLDASSSKKRESELGQKVAEYLNIPFICEDQPAII